MTIKQSLYFNYNGTNSQDLGITQVSVSNGTGLFQEQFLSDVTINETVNRNKKTPYLQGVQRAPLQFDLEFAFDQNANPNCLSKVANLFYTDTYLPFYLSDNPSRIWYCMPSGQSKITHNGNGQGYVTMTLRCDSPYIYQQQVTTPTYDYSTGSGSITIDNTGDVECRPEIWITKVGAGDVSIVNASNGNVEFKYTGLSDGETVYTDNNQEYISTSLADTYRYSNFNDNWMIWVDGNNVLNITGACKIQFRYQFRNLT